MLHNGRTLQLKLCYAHYFPPVPALYVQQEVRRSIITATAATSLMGTFLMGAAANLPLAVAPGMGKWANGMSAHQKITLCQQAYCAGATSQPRCQDSTTRQIWEGFAASQALGRMWLLHDMYQDMGGTAQNSCSKTAPHKLIRR